MRPNKTHVVATLMLLAVAILPFGPLSTNGAYGDIESSLQNVMRAGEWGLEKAAPLSLVFDEPGVVIIEKGEVAGTSTEPALPEGPVLEVSDPIVETTIEEEPPVQETASEEPAIPEEPVVEVSEPVVEVTAD